MPTTSDSNQISGLRIAPRGSTWPEPPQRADDFQVGVCREALAVVVRPSGGLDSTTSPRLALVLASLLGEGCSTVVLDLGDVTYLRSDRAWVVGEAWRLFDQRGGAFVVRRPVASVRDVLAAAGLDALIAAS